MLRRVVEAFAVIAVMSGLVNAVAKATDYFADSGEAVYQIDSPSHQSREPYVAFKQVTVSGITGCTGMHTQDVTSLQISDNKTNFY